jgi:hypothetical protein
MSECNKECGSDQCLAVSCCLIQYNSLSTKAKLFDEAIEELDRIKPFIFKGVVKTGVDRILDKAKEL